MSSFQLLKQEPRTPEELAALKAENSRNYRLRQTGRNLFLSLAASLGIVLLLVLVVVRPEQSLIPEVDYLATASEAQASIEAKLAVPELPAKWRVNSARFSASGTTGVAVWYLGYVTADNQFIGLRQGVDADEVWTARALGSMTPTGSVELAGVTWLVYDHREGDDSAANYEYALSAHLGGSELALYGTANDAEFAELARSATTAMEPTE
jgi:hypothetical protein